MMIVRWIGGRKENMKVVMRHGMR